jgi:WD40 repeat protein
MSTATFTQSLAVVIGISHYTHNISQLQTATNDACKLAQLLQKKHGYQVSLLLDADATKQKLLHWLECCLPQRATSDDRLLFYFAGHGVALNGDDGPAGYLVPQDANPGKNDTFLPMEVLYKALNALPCRHVLIILDCCFSGAFRWSSTRDIATHPEVIYQERYDRFIQDPAWQVITSSAYDQTAFDILRDPRGQGRTGNHSPFAEALFDALRGEADRFPVAAKGQPSGDGVITATELYLYLRDRVELATEAIEHLQTPGLWPLRRHDKGEYIFLVPGHELKLRPAPALTPDKNPYRGLEPFDESHADLFFGRQQLVEELHTFVSEHPLTVVLGASGTGKSSLVKAGLIPRLRPAEDTWRILPPLRPGEAPLRALARTVLTLEAGAEITSREVEALSIALAQNPQRLAEIVLTWGQRHPDQQLLLVVDQLEELTTLCRDEEQRKQFFKLLRVALSVGKEHGRIILTLRSDFEPQFLKTALKTYWMASRFFVKPMTQDELRAAIEQPAAERVMVFEPHDLVDRLINEVVQMPGALPLLSFTLSELYRRYFYGARKNRALTQADYEALGGVAGSLTQRATQEYDQLVKQDSAYRHTLKQVMLRMVAIDGGESARRRVPRSELIYTESEENQRVKTVIQRLTEERLLVEGQDPDGEAYVEPAHDALVLGWNQLQQWKNEEAENITLQRRLTPAVRDWQHKNCPRRDLWTNSSDLDQLIKIESTEQSWLNQLETEFVHLSLKLRRGNRRWRVGLFSGAFALLIMLFFQIGIARERGKYAQLARQITDLERVGMFASQTFQTQETKGLWAALKAAVEANEIIKAEGSEFLAANPVLALQTNLNQVRETRLEEFYNGYVEYVLFNPDGTQIAIQGDKGTEVWNLQNNQLAQIANSATDQGWIDQGALIRDSVSPEGNYTATIDGANTVRLWDSQKNEVARLEGHQSDVYEAVFSPDSQYVATSSADGTARLWDLQGNQLALMEGGNVDGVWFSPVPTATLTDADYIIATSSADSTVRLWDLRGNELIRLKGHQGHIRQLIVNPDGTQIATTDSSGMARLWNLQGNEMARLETNHGLIYDVIFSPASNYIATLGEKSGVRLWDLQGNGIILPDSDQGLIDHVELSSDGNYIAGDTAGSILLWDLQGKLLTKMVTKMARIQVVFSPVQVATPTGLGYVIFAHDWTGNSRVTQLWDLKGNLLWSGDFVSSARFSPDGNYIAMVNSDDTGQLLNVQSMIQGSSKPIQLNGDQDSIYWAMFSPDGNYVATVGHDNTVWLLDFKGNPLTSLAGHQDRILEVVFSPNGNYIATSSQDNTVRLWDLQGNQITQIEGQQIDWRISVIFNPDSNLIATSHYDTVQLWNLEGHQIATFEGHQDNVYQLMFSPDGNYIATTSADDTTRIWALNGQQIAQYEGEGILRDDWQMIATILQPDRLGDNGVVKLWPVYTLDRLDELIEAGCERLRPYLTHSPDITDEERAICGISSQTEQAER